MSFIRSLSFYRFAQCSILLCKPIYYEIFDFNEITYKHIKEGLKVSREDVIEQYDVFDGKAFFYL